VGEGLQCPTSTPRRARHPLPRGGRKRGFNQKNRRRRVFRRGRRDVSPRPVLASRRSARISNKGDRLVAVLARWSSAARRSGQLSRRMSAKSIVPREPASIVICRRRRKQRGSGPTRFGGRHARCRRSRCVAPGTRPSVISAHSATHLAIKRRRGRQHLAHAGPAARSS